MKVKQLTLTGNALPEVLRHIPQPPKQLYVIGETLNELLMRPRVTVIGSRKASPYGRAVTAQLAGGLARAEVVIVSGLALGIDSLAHAAALEVHTPTIAVLPCGFDRIYPASHQRLAEHIVEQGGVLVTEYPPGSAVRRWNFLERNRLASGLSDAVLIIEAAARSGTLSTARHALDQGREVLAVPGSITSPTSAGTNTLLRAGATLVRDTDDILHAIGLEPAQHAPAMRSDPAEQAIINQLALGLTDANEILTSCGLDAARFNQALTMLELDGTIRPLGANHWALN